MKKIYLAFIAVLLVFTACDDYNNQFEGLDEMTKIKAAPVIDITLTDADYSKMGISETAFSADNESTDLIPDFLADMYPYFDEGAACKISFMYNTGEIQGINEYKTASKYTITSEDYLSVDNKTGFFELFTDEISAEDNIPDILASTQSSASDGDLLLVNYNYTEAVNNPVLSLNMIKSDYQIIVDNAESKYISSYGTNDYYYGASAYYGNFDIRIQKRRDNANDVYTDAMSDEEVVSLMLEKIQEGIIHLLETKYPSAQEELDGETILYSVWYKTFADGYITKTWNVVYKAVNGSFELVAGPSESALTNAAPVKNIETYFVYDGSNWSADNNVYHLTSDDYDAMGLSNFSSSKQPGNYLPEFLANKYKYAQESDELFVSYYYNNDIGVDKYIYENGIWAEVSSIIQKTEQYLFMDNQWKFDPAVSFTMVSDDYQMIVDWVKTNKGAEYIDSYGNTEYYSGASSYYKNMTYALSSIMGVTTREEHHARIVETLAEMLKLKFPDAVAQVNGVDVFYTVIYDTYNSDDASRSSYSVKYQCTGANTFAYIEGPTLQ